MSRGGDGIDFGTVLIGGIVLYLLYQMVYNSAYSEALQTSVNPLGLTMDTFPTGTMNVGPQLPSNANNVNL